MNSKIIIKLNNISKLKLKTILDNNDINYYEIKQINNDVYLEILLREYHIISKKLIMYNPKRIKYTGLYLIKYFLKKYQLIVIFSFLAIAFIIASSFFIVDIKIEHNNQDLVNMIYDDLDELGIKRFCPRKSYQELQRIKKIIKSRHLDKIEWLEIKKVGMKYVVSLEERIITKEETSNSYCHLVAKKDALITKIETYKGDDSININEYVQKGDLLISGDVKRNEDIVDKTCANGKVYGEVWYIVNLKIPINYYKKIKTNKKRYNLIIDINDNKYQIFNNRLKNYSFSEKKIFDLLGIKIFLKTDYEIKAVKKQYSMKAAERKAISMAKEKIELKLKKGDTIKSQKVLQKRVNDSTMNIDIFIVAEEDIGYQYIPKEETRDDL